MNTIARTLALPLAAVAILAAGSASAAPAGVCGSVTAVQRHIVEHADQGMGELRSYVQMTHRIHGVSMSDVQEGLDTWRATVNCQNEAAAAKAAENLASAQSADPAASQSGKFLAANR